MNLSIAGRTPGQTVVLAFRGGVSGIGAGTAVANTGSITSVVFASNAFLLTAATDASVTTRATTDNLFLSGAP